MGRSTIGREMEGAHAPSSVAATMEEGPRWRPSGRYYRPRLVPPPLPLDLRRQHPSPKFRGLHPRPWQGVMEDAAPASAARRSSQTRRPMPHEYEALELRDSWKQQGRILYVLLKGVEGYMEPAKRDTHLFCRH